MVPGKKTPKVKDLNFQEGDFSITVRRTTFPTLQNNRFFYRALPILTNVFSMIFTENRIQKNLIRVVNASDKVYHIYCAL